MTDFTSNFILSSISILYSHSHLYEHASEAVRLKSYYFFLQNHLSIYIVTRGSKINCIQISSIVTRGFIYQGGQSYRTWAEAVVIYLSFFLLSELCSPHTGGTLVSSDWLNNHSLARVLPVPVCKVILSYRVVGATTIHESTIYLLAACYPLPRFFFPCTLRSGKKNASCYYRALFRILSTWRTTS
jgi:hypothetical protein